MDREREEECPFAEKKISNSEKNIFSGEAVIKVINFVEGKGIINQKLLNAEQRCISNKDTKETY